MTPPPRPGSVWPVEAGLGAGPDRTLQQQRLLAMGIRVVASVTGVRTVAPSATVNKEVEIDLVFELDGVTHTVTHRQIVSNSAFTAIHLGTELPVLVDPADPSLIVIA